MSSVLADPPALPSQRRSAGDSQPTDGQGPDPRLLALAGLLIASAVGLILALSAGVAGVGAVPAVLRTAVVGIGWFGICGYIPARLLVCGELRAHRMLLVLPVGAVVSSLALTVLGLLHIPLGVSLAMLLSAAGVSIVWCSVRLRGTSSVAHSPHRSTLTGIVLPLMLAGMIGLISLIPIFRAGFATVPGQNGDAILAVGTATLLQHAPPTADRTDLPINHIPLQWRSKYPIYYALAAISTLAGQDPIQTFATVSALVLALTALGFFLFARYLLRAPPWLALGIMFLAPLDRIVMYVTIHPYYNELWGQFTLPFILLAGWRYLNTPTRSSAVLLAAFLVLGLLAYPLMIPFPAAFLIVYAWTVYRRERTGGRSPRWISGLRLPRLHRRSWAWVPIIVLTVPAILVLGRGFLEKTTEAAAVLSPSTSLAGWHGGTLPYLPLARFFGMPETSVGLLLLPVLWLLAGAGLARIRDTRAALGVMIGLAALIAVYFRARGNGELFFFKDLAFAGPYVLMLAVLGLALARPARARTRRAWAAGGAAGLVLVVGLVAFSAGHEIDTTFEQANGSVLTLRSWDRALSRGASVRIDVPTTGYQLWVTYMFKDHPLSALHPLKEFFPYPTLGRKADYVLAEYDQPRPADAIGPPLLRDAQFRLWRMNPSVPGPDISSRHLIDNISSISFG